MLSVDDESPENLDGQIHELFEQVTDDLNVWERISEQYSADLFVGLFMVNSNEGLTLSVNTMKMIAQRKLEIGFDIYAGDQGAELKAAPNAG